MMRPGSYWITWDRMSHGTPLVHRVFKQVRSFERGGYFFRVFRFLEKDPVKNGYVEVEIREDHFRQLLQDGQTRPFLLVNEPNLVPFQRPSGGPNDAA